MVAIRTRDDLLEWLRNNAPSRAIARAMEEGRVENLGAFKRVLPGIGPGWVVKVVSRFKKTWYIVIKQAGFHSFIAWVINTVPWKDYCGGKSENKLYQGDFPEIYEELRNKESYYA